MKKGTLRSFSLGSFVCGLTIGVVGTAVGATRMGSSVFPDVPAGSYYDEAIGEMYGLGVITGFQDGKFKPDDNLSRGQAAVMMKRLRDEIMGIEPTTSESDRSGSSSSRSSRSSSSQAASSSSSNSPPPVTVNEFGKLRFITNAYKQEEDDGSTNVTVIRTGGDKGMITVDYKIIAGTAKPDEDYEAQEGTLIFQDGETSKSFDVKILNDTDNEGDEEFTMEIDTPTGGAEIIDPKVATFTIEDDEGAGSSDATSSTNSPEEGTFRYSATEYAVSEVAGSITIRVERIGGAKGAVTVDYSMTDGTAKSGSDYTKTSGTLSFGDSETVKSFSVAVSDNAQIGGAKTVNLALGNPTGGSVLDTERKVSLLRIADDEVATFGSGSIRFTDNEYEVVESEGSVVILVTRQGGSKGVATVQYKTSNGTAHESTDYKEAEGVLRFEDGETTKSFTVEIIKDAASDVGETVNLNLSNVTGAGISSPSFATLWIY